MKFPEPKNPTRITGLAAGSSKVAVLRTTPQKVTRRYPACYGNGRCQGCAQTFGADNSER